MPRGTQVKRAGLALTVERRGTSSGIALRHPSHHRLPVWSATDHTERETALRGVGLRGQTLKTIRTEGAPGAPAQTLILITPEEDQVLITVGGQSVDFLLDTGALTPCLLKLLAHFLPIHFCNGTVWTSQKVLFQLFFKS